MTLLKPKPNLQLYNKITSNERTVFKRCQLPNLFNFKKGTFKNFTYNGKFVKIRHVQIYTRHMADAKITLITSQTSPGAKINTFYGRG